jgi:hypothetical protein
MKLNRKSVLDIIGKRVAKHEEMLERVKYGDYEWNVNVAKIQELKKVKQKIQELE